MDSCTIFNKQTVEDRSRKLAKKKLCYGRYMPITADHNARSCINRRICKMYNQTGLHPCAPKRIGRNNSVTTSVANPIENDNLGASRMPVFSNLTEMDMKCASAGILAKIISMCIAPVKIGHAGAKKEVSTLAMLDNCSHGTFMKESIQKNLVISGRKTKITMKTLNGKHNMDSTVVTGLKVSKNVHGEGVRWLNFPATYTREALPADVEKVAIQEKAKK